MASKAPLVLLIEDEPQMRRFLVGALRAHEYQVVETACAREGLAQAAGRNPEVILLDLGLPDMDGQEFLRELREWSQVPVIVLTAREDHDIPIRAANANVSAYLHKPCPMPQLTAAIDEALGRPPK